MVEEVRPGPPSKFCPRLNDWCQYRHTPYCQWGKTSFDFPNAPACQDLAYDALVKTLDYNPEED